MVLQTKAFLITTLLKYSPYSSKKRTLIRRVKCAVSHSISRSKRKNSNRTAIPKPASCPTTPDTSEHDAVPPSAPLTPDRKISGGSSSSVTNDNNDYKIADTRYNYTTPVHHNHNHPGTPIDDVETGSRTEEVSQTQAMKLFTKIPFPEPRRVIYLRAHS